MLSLRRRDFLKRGVVVVSAGIALPPVFARAAHLTAEAALQPAFRDRVLVIVQMAGGNDGLNTVIPYSTGSYYDFRKGIGILDKDVLPLDGGIGLHPSLAKMKEIWDEGSLAIIQGVGYPSPSLSHFRSMEIWQTAKPEEGRVDGWLGKYLHHVFDEDGHPLDGVSVGSTMPLSLIGAGSNVAVVDRLDAYRLRNDPGYATDTDTRVDALLNLYSHYPAGAPYAALFNSVAPAAYKSTQELQRAAEAYVPAMTYPTTPLGAGLKMLAQTINAGMGIRVFHIGMGGFDTHAGQRNTQARLLTTLSEGLHAFYRDLQAHGHAHSVMTMTWSEFGRRVRENANGGTDHGTAGPMFVVGSHVQGGLYGEAPSLVDLRNDNLKHTVDFRSVYSTVLGNWMGAPSEDLLGGAYERFPLLAPTPH